MYPSVCIKQLLQILCSKQQLNYYYILSHNYVYPLYIDNRHIRICLCVYEHRSRVIFLVCFYKRSSSFCGKCTSIYHLMIHTNSQKALTPCVFYSFARYSYLPGFCTLLSSSPYSSQKSKFSLYNEHLSDYIWLYHASPKNLMTSIRIKPGQGLYSVFWYNGFCWKENFLRFYN